MIKEVVHCGLGPYGVYIILRVDGMHCFRICCNMCLSVHSRYLVVHLAYRVRLWRAEWPCIPHGPFKIGIFPPRLSFTVHREPKRAPQPRLYIVHVCCLFLSLFAVSILPNFHPLNIPANAQTQQCSHAQHGGSYGEMHTPRPTSSCRRNWSCPGCARRR